MSLKETAKQVLKIIEDGGYTRPNGEWVNMKDLVDYSVTHSKTYTPEMCATLPNESMGTSDNTQFVVTNETTQAATKRLVSEGCEDIVVLNFASARNPGGGFLRGAKAQEEDLTRCSALYSCLVPQTTYYETNRHQKSMLYTDHIIYSPNVPWFRVRSRDEPDELYVASVITAPAPNAAQALARDVDPEAVEASLRRRCGYVLRIAKENGDKNLVLGAWGCGVFGNNPDMVSSVFADWLKTPEFSGAFDRVVFAIMHNEKTRRNFDAFEAAFS